MDFEAETIDLGSEALVPLATAVDAAAPPPLKLLLVANYPDLDPSNHQLHQAMRRCSLVVSLGGVNLNLLSEAIVAAGINRQVGGIVVLGPGDGEDIPGNLIRLHGQGRNIGDWRIAGLSGAKLPARQQRQRGFYVPEGEARNHLEALGESDIFLSHAHPVGLRASGLASQLGLEPLDEYLIRRRPIYYFYAHPEQTVAESFNQENTLAIGVNRYYETPLLEYL